MEGKKSEWPGEAKIAGRAIPAGPVVADSAGTADGEMFVADITEVAVTHLDEAATLLVIAWWTPDGGFRRVERGYLSAAARLKPAVPDAFEMTVGEAFHRGSRDEKLPEVPTCSDGTQHRTTAASPATGGSRDGRVSCISLR